MRLDNADWKHWRVLSPPCRYCEEQTTTSAAYLDGAITFKCRRGHLTQVGGVSEAIPEDELMEDDMRGVG